MNTVVFSQNKLFSLYLETELQKLGYLLTCINSYSQLELLKLHNYKLIIFCFARITHEQIEIFRSLHIENAISTFIFTINASNELIKALSELNIHIITDPVMAPYYINNMLQKAESETQEKSVLTLKPSKSVKEISIDIKKQIVTKGDIEVELTRRELDLLVILLQNKNSLIKKEQMMDMLWNGVGSDANVYITIQKLRKKIEDDPRNPRIILTKKGGGYMLKIP